MSRRANPVDHKSLRNLAFSAKNSRFSNPCDGKFAQAAIGNPLKTMDVDALSGDPTPGSNFATLPALGPLRLRDRRGFVEKPPTPCGRLQVGSLKNSGASTPPAAAGRPPSDGAGDCAGAGGAVPTAAVAFQMDSP